LSKTTKYKKEPPTPLSNGGFMIKMPYNDIINKITEKSDLEQPEIEAKIKKKMDQLSGLISKEGAAHIIANELGIKLIQAGETLQIKNILAGMRNVEVNGRVVDVYEIREFSTEKRQGKVASFILGDETGTIRIVLWNDMTDNLSKIKKGDIVRVAGGYVRENSGRKEVHMNDRSRLILNPNGVSIGDIGSPESSRKHIKDLLENDNNVEVMGTIVQAFEPRFFEVCPECGKRARQREDKFMCDTHNAVTPEYAYLMSAVLDDGTDTVRVVCFRKHAEELTGKSQEQILAFREFPDKFDDVKNELLGTIVKFTGRVNKNDMFDRLEFIANSVNTVPNPEEEIKRLNEEVAKVQGKEAAAEAEKTDS